ncbi:MAG: efflux RND transporter periplasmic adaptor subunit [Thermoanaerobaculia bacterium]|nr:efflux RND transporter periplasmic adaptor subunit [Thermoanaerobaculia bacterium]
MNQRTQPYLRLLGAVAMLVGAIYLSADSQVDPADAQEAPTTKRVRVARVETASESRQLRFSGVTRAARRARLGFAVGSRLVERTVDVGDSVESGQILARVEDREVRNAVATARGAVAEVVARRAQAERDVERVADLVAAKAATDEELEKTRAGLDALRAAEEAARARLDETQRLLGETTLEAPFAGTVLETFVEPGEHVVPGRPVVSVAGRGDLELEVEVPESVVMHLREGAAADVVVPFLGVTLPGELDSVGRNAAGPGRLFPVIARISDDRLVAGATAELSLRLETDRALAVPVAAVINPGGRRPAIFRIEGQEGKGRATKVHVEVGSLLSGATDSEGDRVTVTPTGDFELEAGDLIVVGGQRGLLDGETVVTVDAAGTGSGR